MQCRTQQPLSGVGGGALPSSAAAPAAIVAPVVNIEVPCEQIVLVGGVGEGHKENTTTLYSLLDQLA